MNSLVISRWTENPEHGFCNVSVLWYWLFQQLWTALIRFEFAKTTESVILFHRRSSSVNFRGQDIFAWKSCTNKINKIPGFYVIFAWKIIKMPEFLWHLPYFFLEFFRGARAPIPGPISYAYVLFCKCIFPVVWKTFWYSNVFRTIFLRNFH